MAPLSIHASEHPKNAASASVGFDWEEARYIMLTDNSLLAPDDPAACMDMLVSLAQVDDVQRCIRALYSGLKLASLLEIKGGYLGERGYENIFLIEDEHIIGIFDNRNATDASSDTAQTHPETIEELIDLSRRGQGNIKTLLVFEKANLRLANSDERDRQSNFVAEVVYPALVGIAEGLNLMQELGKPSRTKYLAPSDGTEAINDDLSCLAQSSMRTLKSILNLFKDPHRVNKTLTRHSPLQLFCNADSPFNVNLDSISTGALQTSK